MSLAPHITAVCREYFGTHKIVRGTKQLVGNRCNSCPLRAPCLSWGGKPARTMEELRENGEVFAREASEILNARSSKAGGK